MAKRRYRSKDWPSDSFIEYETREDGSLEIESAFREGGRRNFEYTLVALSHEDARAMIIRVGRDLGLTVTDST